MNKGNEYKKRLRLRLFAAQKGRCCYCEEPIYIPGHESQQTHPHRTKRGRVRPQYLATFEHLHRKSEGGATSVSNLALACHQCNSARGDTDWLTYKSLVMGEISHAEAA